MTIGLNVPITSSWNGKGVKSASKDLGSLEGLADKLTKRLAGAFTIGAIAKFAKSSVEAFSQANKQFTVMSQTLNNLGFNVGLTKLEDFFNKLEMQFGKDKSVLIPAFQTLINSTKDYAKSQELLNLALDVSAGSGKDLGSVSMALGKAYAGQTTALTRLGVGLSAANIKGKSFVDIQKQLTTQFSGSAASAVGTFQGKLDLLKVTFDNMKETIGKGIVDAIQAAFATSNVSGFQSAMEKTAEYISNIAVGLGVIVSEIKSAINSVPSWLKSAINFFNKTNSLSMIADLGKRKNQETKDMLASLADPVAEGLANYNNRALAAKNAKDLATQSAKDLANQKAITDQKKKQLELDKAKQVLVQAGKLLDVEQAQIVAAMMNGTLTENELVRLKLKQALLNDNAKAAQEYANQLVVSQIAMLNLAQANPFSQITSDIYSAIKALLELQAAMNAIVPPKNTYMPTISTAAGTFYVSSTGDIASPSNPLNGWDAFNRGLTSGLYGSQGIGGTTYNPVASGTGAMVNNVNVTVQGSVTTQNDLVSSIVQGIYNKQASGIPISYTTSM